jgi:ATP:ADP antiporter, AAA family
MAPTPASPAPPGLLDRSLGLFTEVHPGEGVRAAAMMANIFVVMVCSYVIKTLREPLILASPVPDWMKAVGVTGPAEVAAYAASAQALLLMGFVPAYSWFASRVDRMKLVCGVTGFFAANILLFVVGVRAGISGVGVLFFVWVGIFNMSIVAQFWSYANDVYTKGAGDRLFPIIGVGMTAGPPVGAWCAGRMFGAKMLPDHMMYVAAALLVTTIALYLLANRGRTERDRAAAADAPIGGKGAFSLVFGSRYIGLIALFLVLANYVNTMGEFLLRKLVVGHANALASVDAAFDARSYVGGFYGSYYFWVNVAAVVLQLFVAPRLVRRWGVSGVLFVLPFIALGAYGVVALGVTMAVVRWAKTAENSTDYSVMNTAKALLWQPTSREEKYKAKQATDSFFVRLGDMASGLVVFVGTTWLAFGVQGFAALNFLVVVAWLLVATALLRENRRLSAVEAADAGARARR